MLPLRGSTEKLALELRGVPAILPLIAAAPLLASLSVTRQGLQLEASGLPGQDFCPPCALFVVRQLRDSWEKLRGTERKCERWLRVFFEVREPVDALAKKQAIQLLGIHDRG